MDRSEGDRSSDQNPETVGNVPRVIKIAEMTGAWNLDQAAAWRKLGNRRRDLVTMGCIVYPYKRTHWHSEGSQIARHDRQAASAGQQLSPIIIT